MLKQLKSTTSLPRTCDSSSESRSSKGGEKERRVGCKSEGINKSKRYEQHY